ncbi:hypothetical protein FGG90_01205 [Clavibacter tessellarius]|uniref:Uncharacterized protein n=2 Tax=Clavibacter tessellarius TaxID=31965 RepID=A0A225CII9_9MICO|nr:hypothetical protein [Clavibacter michiganensis]OQJ61572.1 hypothetical protein B5P24_00205 [Clavibacter michiganensis subsp. tessellarius]UKF32727.1 hypothetical protein FGG90_01205 [Clavibacter michiganensis subsp. tessellarius]
MSRRRPGVSAAIMIPIVVDAIGEVGIMFRWLRRRTRSSEAAPAAPDPRTAGTGTSPADAPASTPVRAPSVSLATGELAAIAARLHGGPVRPPHVAAHKAEPEAPADVATAEAVPVPAEAEADPDLRPIALIVHAALAHHFGPDGAWALVRRTPESTAGFFDELMTAHIARDVALALGAAPAAADLPLEDARATGATGSSAPDARAGSAREDAVARELAVFDEDPLDGALAELAGDPRRVPALLRATRSA